MRRWVWGIFRKDPTLPLQSSTSQLCPCQKSLACGTSDFHTTADIELHLQRARAEGSSLSVTIKHGFVTRGVSMNCHLWATSIIWNYQPQSEFNLSEPNFLCYLSALLRLGRTSKCRLKVRSVQWKNLEHKKNSCLKEENKSSKCNFLLCEETYDVLYVFISWSLFPGVDC